MDIVPPDDLTEDDVRAVKALAQGAASDLQQRVFMELLVSKLSRVSADCFMPDDRQTAYALGRRYPGLMVRSMVLAPVDAYLPKSRR